MSWFKTIDSIALAVQFAGAIIMFLNSPDNTRRGDPTFDSYEQLRQIDIKKNKMLRVGFLLLSVGITIALVSTLLKK